MKHRTCFFFVASALFFLLILVTGCSKPPEQTEAAAVPVAAPGQINEVAVIADKRIWEGPVGDTLRAYYAVAYPILPQHEPLYDLRFFSMADLDKNPSYKQQKHYLILGNLGEQDGAINDLIQKDIGVENARLAQTNENIRFLIGRDKWAKDQVLAYQFAYSDTDLINSIRNSFPVINKRFKTDNARRIEATVFGEKGENQNLMAEVKNKMDVEIRIPENYEQVINDGEVIWLRMETDSVKSNLIFRKIPYIGKEQLTRENIKAVRNAIGRKYISTEKPGSYMQVDDKNIPLYVSSGVSEGNEVLEARGVWTMVNDRMGGPFISYLIYNPAKKDLLWVDGFLHAPGQGKRNYMQQLEYILSGAKY